MKSQREKSNPLKKHLHPGRVYRREELARLATNVDRHLRELVDAGVLLKLQNGLYHFPKKSPFGQVPATERELVRRFLREDPFLLSSPNAYNALGVGTTQLYNHFVVYNHKRQGQFELGGMTFKFRRKARFPRALSTEFLLVDLLNNLDQLAEDPALVRERALTKAKEMNPAKLRRAAKHYGKATTRKLLGNTT